MRRLLVLLSALAALATIGPMAALGQEATPEPGGGALTRTDTRYVIPYGPDGLNAGLTVRETLTGTCIGESIVVSDRADAFECLGDGSQVYDPCFENPFAPWDLPWALELANGDRCTLQHGTLYQLAGQIVYYGCEQKGAVLGVVDHGQPVWTVNYLADGDVASSLVEVTAAWS